VILGALVFMRTNAALPWWPYYGSRGVECDVGQKVGEAPHIVDERLVTPNISMIRTSFGAKPFFVFARFVSWGT
jgi:hypothetical protein